MSQYIFQIIDCIKEAEKNGQLRILEGVTGLSGDKLIGFLQRSSKLFSQSEKNCYVEVGVFQGLTLTSVAAVSELACYGIDNFSEHDENGENQSIVKNRLHKHTQQNAKIINLDFEEALLSLKDRIGEKEVSLYFIDGPHDYRSQYLCLDFSKKALADDVVIVIDDANYEHVRRSTADWLKANSDFALLFEAYTPAHPKNGAELEENARNGWWDGVNIIVRDTSHILPRTYPIVNDDRTRYYNDHLIHASRYAEAAPKVLSLLSHLSPSFINRGIYKNRFHAMNTYSSSLSQSNIVEPK